MKHLEEYAAKVANLFRKAKFERYDNCDLCKKTKNFAFMPKTHIFAIPTYTWKVATMGQPWI